MNAIRSRSPPLAPTAQWAPQWAQWRLERSRGIVSPGGDVYRPGDLRHDIRMLIEYYERRLYHALE